ncbi:MULTISPECIES: hypothetical protein [Enterococcus]|uniref:hypothetical protein n=1 Tax=Enterococcus TaxID=1350 RepID=UPI0008A2285D|nr:MULTISPECIES: hypothetical protein [Enterococcus]MDB1729491.1 hypothetical protein [Enterococcus avium]MDB1733567.1 hypothetical protein [Enterococcus avium]OFL82145.1 hypothetical protein HMPREF2742_08755 [Enterococcus sp. HMSC072H05]
MLPEFGGLTTWAQTNSKEILLTGLMVIVVVLLVKREIGSLIGTIFIVGLLIVMISDPDSTIIKIAQGIIDKVMGTGGG